MFELVITRPDEAPRRIRLQGGVYGIGRHERNDIVLNDQEVSRQHARLLVDGEVVLMEDLGSGNGTWIGGRRVQEHTLALGDELVILPFTLSLRQVDDALPPPPPEVWLEGVDGPHRGERIDLDADAITIGRGADQDLVLDDRGASRAHAVLRCVGDVWRVRDEGSANGVFVNGVQISEAPLHAGDVLEIGNSQFKFHVDLPELPTELGTQVDPDDQDDLGHGVDEPATEPEIDVRAAKAGLVDPYAPAGMATGHLPQDPGGFGEPMTRWDKPPRTPAPTPAPAPAPPEPAPAAATPPPAIPTPVADPNAAPSSYAAVPRPAAPLPPPPEVRTNSVALGLAIAVVLFVIVAAIGIWLIQNLA